MEPRNENVVDFHFVLKEFGNDDTPNTIQNNLFLYEDILQDEGRDILFSIKLPTISLRL